MLKPMYQVRYLVNMRDGSERDGYNVNNDLSKELDKFSSSIDRMFPNWPSVVVTIVRCET